MGLNTEFKAVGDIEDGKIVWVIVNVVMATFVLDSDLSPSRLFLPDDTGVMDSAEKSIAPGRVE